MNRLHRLGRFVFDVRVRVLMLDGDIVPLTPKCALLLALLYEANGLVVAHAEIQEALWPQGWIDPGNLTQTVYMLRAALALDAGVKVENVPRRGYRLVLADWTGTNGELAVAI